MGFVNLILVLIPIGIFIFLIKASNSKCELKKMIPITLIYIIITILLFILISNISMVKEQIINSSVSFQDSYVILLLSASLSPILVAPLAVFMDRVNEAKVIRKLESKYRFEKIEYFRELIKNIPIAMLGIIYNPKTNIDDLITATIISINNNETRELKQHELFIKEQLRDKNRYEIKDIHKIFKRYLIEDLEKDSYLSKKENRDLHNTDFVELIIATLIITELIEFIILVSISSFGLFLFIGYFLCFAPIPFIKWLIKTKKPIVRNEKGLELKVKLAGLKKYLVDFTTISNKNIEEIKLYDDYILYAIIFDLKGTLNEEGKALYNNFNINKGKKIKIIFTKEIKIMLFIFILGFSPLLISTIIQGDLINVIAAIIIMLIILLGFILLGIRKE